MRIFLLTWQAFDCLFHTYSRLLWIDEEGWEVGLKQRKSRDREKDFLKSMIYDYITVQLKTGKIRRQKISDVIYCFRAECKVSYILQ